jgi:hypothetical protein
MVLASVPHRLKTMPMKSRVETALLQTLLASLGCVAACGARTPFGEPVPGGDTIGADGAVVPPSSIRCTDPTPVVDDSSGFVSCANNYVYRREVRQCPSSVPRAGTFHLNAMFDQCSTDADCAGYMHGYCDDTRMLSGGTYCLAGCVSDAECPPSEICECADPIGTCRLAACKSSADCSSGQVCASYDASPGCYQREFACQTPKDICAGDKDCPKDQFCTIAPNGDHRQCSPVQCIIGRPYVVAGEHRVAPLVSSTAWLASSGDWPDGELGLALSSEDCDTVARHWARAAQLEHASIAAFARFQLQLLRFGAPAELVSLCSEAMTDEVIHAKLCFGLAKRYGGADAGPGELAVGDSLGAVDLAGVLRETVEEGCIGEALAALEAGEGAGHASDADVRDVLLRIHADESRHAALAFQFVAWVWDTRIELRSVIQEAFENALRARVTAQASVGSPQSLRLSRHGVVSPAVQQRIRERGLREVVLPSWAALSRRASSKRDVSFGLPVES